MTTGICTECKHHESTCSGDRCVVESRERPVVKNPIDGKSGWGIIGGGFTTVSRHPLCSTHNTLNNPCELFESKTEKIEKRDLFVKKETENDVL